jgi:(2R)-sulfolactate sulfo-lyase subunit alpha
MAHQFLVHDPGDHVGVAVADIRGGEGVVGVYLDSGETIEVTAHADVPLGHKLALKDVEEGGKIIKYGTQIGVARSPIQIGDYVHTHNVRSARW